MYEMRTANCFLIDCKHSTLARRIEASPESSATRNCMSRPDWFLLSTGRDKQAERLSGRLHVGTHAVVIVAGRLSEAVPDSIMHCFTSSSRETSNPNWTNLPKLARRVGI